MANEQEQLDSPEYSLITLWSDVIASTISQNIPEISEGLLKETLIPSNILDQIATVDYTPLRKAEILCRALREEIKKDFKVLYKFIAVLSTFEQNKLLVRTLKNFLPKDHVEAEGGTDGVEKVSDDDVKAKLYKAIADDDIEFVCHLLESGTIDINQPISRDGKHFDTALEVACAKGSHEIVELLIEYGADVNQMGSFLPLTLVCELGNLEIVKTLLKHGARVNIGIESGDMHPLVSATASGRTDIVKILLEHGALVGSRTIGGLSPLQSACTCGFTEIAKLLLDYGAPVNVILDDGLFSLLAASINGYPDLVQLLLQHNAHIDLQNKDGTTALISASENGHTKVVKILLEHGADMSLITKCGFFALERASAMGHYAVVKLLIQHNVDVNMSNKQGFTALMRASIHGHFNIVKFLLEAGADTRIMTKDGRKNTAADLAVETGHIQIKFLLSGRPTVKEAFIALLPLAAKWKTIGFLLDLDELVLAHIECSTDDESLRLMIRIWLGTSNPYPTWEGLAEAIKPLDKTIAENIASLCKS